MKTLETRMRIDDFKWTCYNKIKYIKKIRIESEGSVWLVI